MCRSPPARRKDRAHLVRMTEVTAIAAVALTDRPFSLRWTLHAGTRPARVAVPALGFRKRLDAGKVEHGRAQGLHGFHVPVPPSGCPRCVQAACLHPPPSSASSRCRTFPQDHERLACSQQGRRSSTGQGGVPTHRAKLYELSACIHPGLNSTRAMPGRMRSGLRLARATISRRAPDNLPGPRCGPRNAQAGTAALPVSTDRKWGRGARAPES